MDIPIELIQPGSREAAQQIFMEDVPCVRFDHISPWGVLIMSPGNKSLNFG
jgi:hypothetical protein